MQTPEHTVLTTVAELEANGLSQTPVIAEAPTKPAIPVPEPTLARGRAEFSDPTKPEQIHAIAQRCKYHYVLVPALNAYVKVTRKEIIRVIKDLPSNLVYIEAKLSENNGEYTLAIG